jgi:hypothetical protein
MLLVMLMYGLKPVPFKLMLLAVKLTPVPFNLSAVPASARSLKML